MVTYKDDVVVTGTPVDDYMSLEARINRMEIVQVEDFRSFIDFPINKCLLTAEPDVAEQVEQELVALYGDSVTVFRSEPFFVVICMAASASFSTPIGYQTNLIVQGIGNYKFTDFVRIGLPLNIIAFLISIFLIPLIWPF